MGRKLILFVTNDKHMILKRSDSSVSTTKKSCTTFKPPTQTLDKTVHDVWQLITYTMRDIKIYFGEIR